MEVIWSRSAKKKLYAILERHINATKSKEYSSVLFKKIVADLKTLVKYPVIGLRTSEDNIYGYVTESTSFFFETSGNRIIIHTVSEKEIKNPILQEVGALKD